MKIKDVSVTDVGVQVVVEHKHLGMTIPFVLRKIDPPTPMLKAIAKQLKLNIPEIGDRELTEVHERRFSQTEVERQYSFK